MSTQVVKHTSPKLSKLLAEAHYSGERFIIKDEKGAVAALVPIEDLELLELGERDARSWLE